MSTLYSMFARLPVCRCVVDVLSQLSSISIISIEMAC